MENLNALSPYAKVKVYWEDSPENYTKEAKNRIRSHFAKKYGFNKNNIDVVYRPVKFSENGDVIEINGANIENIMDSTYQRELMKEWIKRENIIVDFDRILALDDIVNSELNIENDSIQHKSWSIRWLMIDNFLSFGEKNYLPFNKLKGLTVVNSLPANQGGKTTLTIDALKFLLHGNTTKTDKNEEIFNKYSDKNELVVRGMIEIMDEETIIERKMKRSAKKGGGWNVTNKVNYFKLLPDGEEEQLNEEDAIRTTAKLKNTIGNEKEFEMLALATERNLDDLIGLTTTESSKVLTRLIGLEIIEQKEAAVRKMYNEFDKKKKSNQFDVVSLTHEIEDHNEKIEWANRVQSDFNKRLEETKKVIIKLNNDKDTLLNEKITIDVNIITLNPSTLKDVIEEIIKNGKELAKKKEGFVTRIIEIGEINFDEDEYEELTKLRNRTNTAMHLTHAEIERLKATINDLIAGGICKACNRKLDDVDNTEHIKKHEAKISEQEIELEKYDKLLLDTESKLLALDNIKKLSDEKNRVELARDKAEVEIGALRNKLTEKKNDLKKYELNQSAIEQNKRIDSEVEMIKTKLNVSNYEKDDLNLKLQKIGQEIINNNAQVESKIKLIAEIKKEEEKERIFKVYIDLVGKKGISKLVLRSILPIINSEVQRLLEDAADFEIEIFIDDKNDVQFLLNKDGESKSLKSGSGFEKTVSSLALRGVLGKLSTLPMPNFITFDEVLGKVANENLDKLKPLFDKIKNMYDIVFLITHNDIIKDWSDNIVTVIKENNISELKLK